MRSLTLGVSPLPALALLLALLSPLSAHAQAGGFGLGPAQGSGGGIQTGDDATLGDVTVDQIAGGDAILDVLGGTSASKTNFTSSSNTSVHTLSVARPGGTPTVGLPANGLLAWGATTNTADSGWDFYLRRSGVSTAEFSSDGAGGDCTVVISGAATGTLTVGNINVGNTLDMFDDDVLRMGNSQDFRMEFDSNQTNDALVVTFDAAASGSAFILADEGNVGVDLGLSDFADPVLVMTSATSWGTATDETLTIRVDSSTGYARFNTGATAHWMYFELGSTVELAINPAGITLGSDYVGWGSTGTAANYGHLFVDAEGVFKFTNGGGTTSASEARLYNAAESAYVGYRALTSSPDTTTPTLAALPTGGTAGQVGWLQVSINGTTSYIPYWQ